MCEYVCVCVKGFELRLDISLFVLLVVDRLCAALSAVHLITYTHIHTYIHRTL